MAPRILIVEDEADMAHVLRAAFEGEGYRVFSAPSAEAGLKKAGRHRPDIIILDIMLPKMDGLEMLRLLRRESQAPVLVMSAKKEEIDRILGFKLGADDYISKPFSIVELTLRVKAILKSVLPRAAEGEGKGLRIGGVEIDFERHEVRLGGKAVNLAPREFQILRLLVEARGRVLSREEISKALWGDERSFEIDLRGVDQHVARLRKKLLAERNLIGTVSHRGYQAKLP